MNLGLEMLFQLNREWEGVDDVSQGSQFYDQDIHFNRPASTFGNLLKSGRRMLPIVGE